MSSTNTPVFGPWMGTVCVVTALWAAAAVLRHVPEVAWWAPVPAGGAVIAATVLGAAACQVGRAGLLVRGLWPLAAAGWLVMVIRDGGPSVGALGVLCCGAVVAAAALSATGPERAVERVPHPGGKRGRLPDRWRRILADHARIDGARIDDIEWWDDVADPVTGEVIAASPGYTVYGSNPPSSGVGAERLQEAADKIANALKLPKSCGIDVVDGAERGDWVASVPTTDVLTRTIHLPEDYSPMSIRDDYPIGLRRDGSVVVSNMCWDSKILCGLTRWGKSNALKVDIIAHLRMVDEVVFVIDRKGGSLALQFLAPWLRGRVSRPALHWVALTDTDLDAMLTWCEAAQEFRDGHYAADQIARNDDKLLFTAGLPHITIIADEFSKLPASARKRLMRLNDIGGSVGIRLLTVPLRATAEYVPAGLRKMSVERMSVRVDDVSELAHLFESTKRLPRLQELPAPGYAIHRRTGRASLLKLYRADPETCERAVLATEHLRPDMDPGTAGAHPAHAARWDTVRPALLAALHQGHAPPDPDPEPETATEGRQGPGWLPRRPAPGASAAERAEWLAASAETRAHRRRLRGIAADAPIDAEIDAIEAAWAAEAAAGRVPRILTAAIEAAEGFTGAGGERLDRVHSAHLAELVGVDESVLNRLLFRAGVRKEKDPFVSPKAGRPERARGVTLTHLRDIADRIRGGELTPTPDVWEWRPT